MKIAILPGDGIGTEIVAQAERVLGALDLRFETERARRRRRLRGARPPAARSDARAREGRRRGAVRRGRRLEVRHAGAPAAPRAGDPRPAQDPRPVRQLPPGDLLRRADGGIEPEARARRRARHPDHPRADRRHLFRPAARPPRASPDGAFAGADEAFDTMRYTRPEIERIAHVAFRAARKRASAASG